MTSTGRTATRAIATAFDAHKDIHSTHEGLWKESEPPFDRIVYGLKRGEISFAYFMNALTAKLAEWDKYPRWLECNYQITYMLPFIEKLQPEGTFYIYIIRDPYETIASLYWIHPASFGGNIDSEALRTATLQYKNRRVLAENALKHVPANRKLMINFDYMTTVEGWSVVCKAVADWFELEDMDTGFELQSDSHPAPNSSTERPDIWRVADIKNYVDDILNTLDPWVDIELSSV